MLFFVKCSSSYVIKSTIQCNSEWYICKLLTNYHVFSPAKIQISKIVDVPYIRAYVWFKDEKHIIWMWIWLILKNISLLDRIWSLWLVRFTHSTPNSIFCLDRLIFSESINSHPDNIYTYHIADRKLSLMKCCVLCYDIYKKKS